MLQYPMMNGIKYIAYGQKWGLHVDYLQAFEDVMMQLIISGVLCSLQQIGPISIMIQITNFLLRCPWFIHSMGPYNYILEL